MYKTLYELFSSPSLLLGKMVLDYLCNHIFVQLYSFTTATTQYTVMHLIVTIVSHNFFLYIEISKNSLNSPSIYHVFIQFNYVIASTLFWLVYHP